MKNSALILFLFLLLISCSKKEEKLKEQIIGTWVEFNPDTIGEYPHTRIRPPGNFAIPRGYTFYDDGIAENHRGYFNKTEDSITREKRIEYLGNKTKYFIKKDSIGIFNPITKKYWTTQISFVNKDTFKLITTNPKPLHFSRFKHSDVNSIDFDKIVVSYWIMGFDFVYLTLYKNGRVEYFTDSNQDEKSLFVGKINDINYYFNKFKNVNFKKLNDFYYHGLDGQSVEIKFLKNGEVIKTVVDGNYSSPHELIWAYIPLLYIYEEIELTKSNDIYFDKELFKTTEIDTINHIY